MMVVATPAHSWDWRTNTYLLAGVMAYCLAVMLGLASLPSISSALSWREFRMFQSFLGWLCLVLSCTHAALNGWKKLVRVYSGLMAQLLSFLSPSYQIEWEDCIFPGSEQMALFLPAITMVASYPASPPPNSFSPLPFHPHHHSPPPPPQVAKLPLLLPWVDARLTAIRTGQDF